MKYIFFICFIVGLNSFMSCNQLFQNQSPEILTAEYELKSFNETERGFQVFLVIEKLQPQCKIKGIILKNNHFESIESTEMLKNRVFIDQFLILQSNMIQNFKPPLTDNRKDGILFEIEGKEFYKEINFKLKQ